MDAASNAMISALAQYQAIASSAQQQQNQNRLLISAAAVAAAAASSAAAAAPQSHQAFQRNYLNSLAAAAPSQMPLLQQYAAPTPQVPSNQNLINLAQGPSTALSTLNDLQAQIYYQQFLSSNALLCTCGCTTTCRLHEAIAAANPRVPSPPPPPVLSSAFFNTQQLRSLVVPPTPLMSSPLLQPRQITPVNHLAAAQQQLSLQQFQASQQQQFQAAAAAATAATSSTHQPRESTLRPKRSANFGNDGRPASKVRRITSIDSNTPSSSQAPAERLEATSSIQVPTPLPTCCTICRATWGPGVVVSPLCACHNSESCQYAGTSCTACFFQYVIQQTPEYLANPAYFEAMNPLHQRQIEQRRAQQQRQREASFNFYNRNVHDLQSPSPTMMLVNPRTPYMDILFLTSESFAGPASVQAAQQIQTLHQVLTQNPHITEPPPIGAESQDQIKKNTTVLSYKKDPNVPEQEIERCTVCLCDFENGDEVRALNCSHLFHIECIDRWLIYNKKCPVCRVEMDKPAGFATIIDYDRGEVLEPAAAS